MVSPPGRSLIELASLSTNTIVKSFLHASKFLTKPSIYQTLSFPSPYPVLVTTCGRLKHVFHITSHVLVTTGSRLKHVFRMISPVLVTTCSRLKHVFHIISPFWVNLLYFTSVSLLGFLLLATLPMKHPSIPRPSRLDLLFMSVSASTVSSMDTAEMESFSNSQLTVLTLLMLISGQVFTSMLRLLFCNFISYTNIDYNAAARPSCQGQELELGMTPVEKLTSKQSSSRYLLYVVLAYLILVHASGFILIFLYLSLFPNSKGVLERKGIWPSTFVVFTTVSSFANCGFIPTNENMEVFKTCSGILLIIGCLVLLGNTMYPIGLRVLVWVLKRLTRRKEYEFILSDVQRSCLGYNYHLTSGWLELGMLGVTVSVLVLVQALLFCCFEWSSEGLEGMNDYQKVVGSLFMSVSSRHSGESIVDLSNVSPAILVLFVVMMYLPPYTTYLPKAWRGEEEGKKKENIIENFILSRLSYLAIFIIIICITERRHISEDPLNFKVLNIVIEVVSAYANVGFTTGYSCKRQLKVDGSGCLDSWIGFSGRWTGKGKLTLIVVMIFGRLKKFNMAGGQAWMIR